MSIFLFFTGFSFFIPSEEVRIACVATGIYLFMVVYVSPLTYSLYLVLIN